MSQEKAVLIFVAADNCGGCSRFKKHFWNDTKKELAGIEGLRVIQYEISRIGDLLPPGAHPDLSRFVKWYPTFILVSSKSHQRDSPHLEGVVFNGVQVDGIWDIAPPAKRMATDNVGIIKWVREELSNNPLFKKGVSFSALGTKGILKAPPKAHLEVPDEDDDDDIYSVNYCQQIFVPFN
jgi:hypothetical protein